MSKPEVLSKIISQGEPLADGVVDASEVQNFATQVRNSISGSADVQFSSSTGTIALTTNVLAYSLILG